MFRQLPPRLPLVWRDPYTLQLGVDRPRAQLDHVTLSEERLLHLLHVGVDDATYQGCGEALDVSPARRDQILATFAPVPPRIPPSVTATQSIIVLSGTHPARGELTRILTSLHHTVAAQDSLAHRSPSLAVICADYAVAPSRYRGWLSADVPHVPLVFSDETVRWGPIVEPGTSGCLLCVDLHQRDTDPAWPAIASQLAQSRAPAQREDLLLLAVAHLAGDIHNHLTSGRSTLRSRSARLDSETRTVTYTETPVHSECGCLSLTRPAHVRGG
ncbi:hypothetical protein [Klugiella xanthotipulae]|nr:hypothetical protein [Klugiella xanthotipulae]